MSQGAQQGFNSFPKLDGTTNYTAWTIRLKAVLGYHGVLDVVFDKKSKDLPIDDLAIEPSSSYIAPSLIKLKLEEAEGKEDVSEEEFKHMKAMSMDFESERNRLLEKIEEIKASHAKTESQASPISPAESATKLRERKAKACHIILMCLHDRDVVMLQSIDDPEDPSAMIAKLDQEYIKQTLGTKLQLLQKLSNLKLKGNDVDKFVRAIDKTCQELLDIKTKISYESKLQVLTSGLPPTYNIFKSLVAQHDINKKLKDADYSRFVQQLRNFQVQVQTQTKGENNGGGDNDGDDGKGMVALMRKEFANLTKKWEKNNGNKSQQGGKEEKQTAGDEKKKRKRCTHCKGTSHWVEKCWVLHPDLKPKAQTNLAAEQGTKSTEQGAKPSGQVNSVTNHNEDAWYIDSGTSFHICSNLNAFRTLTEVSNDMIKTVKLPNGSVVELKFSGTVYLQVGKTSNKTVLKLTEVMYSPSLAVNLVSVARLVKQDGDQLVFDRNKCRLTSNGSRINVGRRVGSLYLLYNAVSLHTSNRDRSVDQMILAALDRPDLWHERLGHINKQYIKMMASNGSVKGLPHKPKLVDGVCEVCGVHKHTKVPLPKIATNRATAVFQRLCLDLMGPFKRTMGGCKYVLTIVDDYSRYTVTYLLKAKSDAEQHIRQFITDTENRLSTKVKTIRSDSGGEFMSNEFKSFLNAKGITRERTVPGNSEQNGVVERAQRTLQNAARSMLGMAKMPYGFWGEAMLTATYLKNRTITKALRADLTPYEVFYGIKPCVSHLRVFGSTAYAQQERSNKLANTAIKTRMLGYSPDQKAYRLWDPVGHKIIHSRSVRFQESQLHTEPDGSETLSDLKIVIDDNDPSIFDHSNDSVLGQAQRQPQSVQSPQKETESDCAAAEDENDINKDNIIVSRSENSNSTTARGAVIEKTAINQTPTKLDFERQLPVAGFRKSPGELDDIEGIPVKMVTWDPQLNDTDATSDQETIEDEDTDVTPPLRQSERLRSTWSMPERMQQYYGAFSLADEDPSAPETYHEALACPDSNKWKAAIKSELDSLAANGTWFYTVLPPRRKAIGTKWVFKHKTDETGKVIRYKARLTAKGYAQVEGLDYNETYAPTSRYSTVRIFLVLALQLKLTLMQMDIKTAFLYGVLEEEIYLNPPQGVDVPQGKVLRLRKSLYGLKQAPRVWNETIHKSLTALGGSNSAYDECIYVFREGSDIALLNLFVDDILLAFLGVMLRDKIVTALKSTYDVSDMGTPKFCLGMGFEVTEQCIKLSQGAAVDKFLRRFNLDKTTPVLIPMDTNFKSIPRDHLVEPLCTMPYRAAIGCLLYLSQCTRPDIALAVGILARFSNDPAQRHWVAVKRIFKYLAGTRDLALTLIEMKTVMLP